MEPKKPTLSSKSGSERKSGPWRPTKRQVLWATGMLVASLTTALLIGNLPPEIWKGLLEERNLTLIAIGVSLTAIIVLLAIGGAASRWTGFRGMTVRDWLDLLVVPLALVVISFLFTTQQDQRQQRAETQRAKAEQELAEQRAQDEALQAYLDQMTVLMVQGGLYSSEKDSGLRTLAQARTLTLLQRLDPRRKTEVLQFLIEANLVAGVGQKDPIISLHGAELRGVNLSYTNLSGADLSEANLADTQLLGIELNDANLSNADLDGAHMTNAELKGADLFEADLDGSLLISSNLNQADMSEATLHGANLSDAELSDATWSFADLTGADLRGADLIGVTMRDVTLDGANLSNTDLTKAILTDSLFTNANVSGATLDDAVMLYTGYEYADLSGADLSNVNWSWSSAGGADLTGADLSNVNMRGTTGLPEAKLEKQTVSLKGATMPNGQKYED